MSRALNFSITEPQSKFLALDCMYPAFIGGMGSGKSHCMAIRGFLDALDSPNAIIAFYQPTWEHVRSIIWPKIVALLEEHGIAYEVNKQEHVIRTKSSQVGDFKFHSMTDPEQIVGYEFYRAHVDEIDTLPEDKAREIWHKLLGRNRQRPAGLEVVKNRIAIYSTPEGYKFAYKMWGDEEGKGYGFNEEYKAVHADTRQNPYASPEFIKSLFDTYPAHLAEAYVAGKFVNLSTATVYPAYKRDVCFSNEFIEKGENLYIGCDFNVHNTAATVYVKRNRDQWHAVDELKQIKDTPTLIDVIQNKWQSQGHKIIMYPDCSGRASNATNADESSIALLIQAGFIVRARKKNPYVKDRIQAMNRALSTGKVFINTVNCPTTARCLEQQAYDSKGDPDKKSGYDHQNDATTYPIAYEMPIKKPLFALDYAWVS